MDLCRFLADSDPNLEKKSDLNKNPDLKHCFFPEYGSKLAKNPDPIQKIRIHEKNVKKLEVQVEINVISYLALSSSQHCPFCQVSPKPI